MKKTFKYILTVALSAFFGIQMNAQNDNGVVLDKHVTDNEDGTYNITLESYVTGETVMKPMDIVLVLDNSNSMHNANSTYGIKNGNNWETKNTALRRSVVAFIENIKGSVNHNIALIEFEGGGRRIDHYLKIDDNNLRAYNLGVETKATNVTKKATWYDMSSSSDVTDVKNIVNHMNTGTYLTTVSGDTGTPAADGLRLANKLLTEVAGNGREKLVIFFTDGCCGTSEEWAKDEKGDYFKGTDYNGYPNGYVTPNRLYAPVVIKEANKLKDKATVVCIGTFNQTTMDKEVEGKHVQKEDIYFYLRHISSEYSNEIRVDGYAGTTPAFGTKKYDWSSEADWRLPNPGINVDEEGKESSAELEYRYDYKFGFHSTDEGKDKLETLDTEKGLVYDASNSALLASAFTSIASKIQSSAKLDNKSTVVLDALTNMFKLPANTHADDIHLYTCNATGNGTAPSWETTGTDGETHYKDSDNKDLGTTAVTGARAEYWVPWTPWDDEDDMLNYIKINPSNPVAEVTSGSDVLEVTGFNFAENCVAKNKSGNYTGMKLIIQFEIETDPANTGGVSLQTNDGASGIYYKPEGSSEYEAYEKYEQPVVYLPYLKIIKKGLEQHESAAFRITKVTGEDGASASADETAFTATVMLSQENANTADVEAIVKLLHSGYYKVEELDWSWTYSRGDAQTKHLSTVDQASFSEGNGYVIFTFTNTKDNTTKGNAAEWCVINEMGL